jgi:hypothetical protein
MNKVSALSVLSNEVLVWNSDPERHLPLPEQEREVGEQE